jgi:radical SAM superfamily enzyme YgiQ (UPF0313 family)
LGFSVHAWSERLSDFCAKRTKEISRNTVIVAGGPSIDDVDAELLRYLRLRPYYDICIPNEGEISFIRLIEHFESYGKLLPDETIEGCARLSSSGSLLRGSYALPDLSSVPSPYLEGILDTFLSQGYEPIIQSMRGCPYGCEFCVSGTPQSKKIRTFDLERVSAEIKYIRERTKSEYLILTDENLGLLKDRDVGLAEHIIRSFREHNYPSRLYFYSAKIITDSVLKVIEILSLIGEFGMSFQTLAEDVRKEIKRTNIRYEQFLEYVQWAKKRKIITSTEMIFGFPGETVITYLNGLERLLLSGVDRINSYNLRLLSGSGLSSQLSRDKYKFVTMYRLSERTFGSYDGTVVADMEEIVVGSNSLNYADYQKVRKYGLFLELSSGRGYLSELIWLMIRSGLPGERLITFLAACTFDHTPKLSSVINEYTQRIKDELYQTPEACTAYVNEFISGGLAVPETKLNLVYTGKIMLDKQVRFEFFKLIKEFIHRHNTTDKQVAFFCDYIDNILDKQIVSFSPIEENAIQTQTHINIDRLKEENYDSIDDLSEGNKISVDLILHRDATNFIQKNHLHSFNDEKILQDIYMTVTRFGLLRTRKVSSEKLLIG